MINFHVLVRWKQTDTYCNHQHPCSDLSLDLCLPQSEQDENMIEMAGDDVDVPEELLKMVDEDATEEEGKDSLMGQIQNLQNMDMDQLKEKASATVTELKSKAEEKCSVMWGREKWWRRREWVHFVGIYRPKCGLVKQKQRTFTFITITERASSLCNKKNNLPALNWIYRMLQ